MTKRNDTLVTDKRNIDLKDIMKGGAALGGAGIRK
jgi:hypothetical protein